MRVPVPEGQRRSQVLHWVVPHPRRWSVHRPRLRVRGRREAPPPGCCPSQPHRVPLVQAGRAPLLGGPPRAGLQARLEEVAENGQPRRGSPGGNPAASGAWPASALQLGNHPNPSSRPRSAAASPAGPEPPRTTQSPFPAWRILESRGPRVPSRQPPTRLPGRRGVPLLGRPSRLLAGRPWLLSGGGGYPPEPGRPRAGKPHDAVSGQNCPSDKGSRRSRPVRPRATN